MAVLVSSFELVTAGCVVALVTAIDHKATLTDPALAVLAMYIMKNVLAYLEIKNLATHVQQLNYDLKISTMCAYINMDYESFVNINTALPTQVIENDTERVTTLGLSALGNMVSESIVSLALFIYCFVMHPLIAIGVLAIIASVIWMVKKSQRLSGLNKQIQENALLCGIALNQLFGGLREIKVARALNCFIFSYAAPLYDKCKLQAKCSAAASAPRLIVEILFALLVVVIVFCAKENLLTILNAYLYAGFRLMPAFNRIVTSYSTLKAVSPSIERLYACNIR